MTLTGGQGMVWQRHTRKHRHRVRSAVALKTITARWPRADKHGSAGEDPPVLTLRLCTGCFEHPYMATLRHCSPVATKY